MKLVSKKTTKKLGERKKTLFWSLACLLLALSSLYIFFVNTAAVNAVGVGKAAAERDVLRAPIGELETAYLARKQQVTLSLAYRAGFEDARAVRFLGRKSVGVLSRNNDL